MNASVVKIVIGSKSDLDVVQKTEEVLRNFDVSFDTEIISAHRTPERASFFSKNAKKNGVKVIIAAAGKAAHLAGAIAGQTMLPVIGIPMKTNDLGGMDSLLSVVQMPKGVPVATVAIGGAENAAILAVQILALSDESLNEKLIKYKEKMKEDIDGQNKLLKSN